MASQTGGRGIEQLQQLSKQAWGSFIDLLFPPQCGGCRRPGTLWCETCRAGVTLVRPPLCEKCGQPNVASRLCVNCRTSSLQIEFIRSAAVFEGSLRQAIHRFKYARLASLAEPLGQLLADGWEAHAFQADWLVPVPLHPARERERGYNQAALLARQLARHSGVPLLEHALQRTRATAVQMELNAAERQLNVAGAFACAEPRIKSKRVVVIDDVCTTGATVEACAEALLKAGAASVMGLTLARTPYGDVPQSKENENGNGPSW